MMIGAMFRKAFGYGHAPRSANRQGYVLVEVLLSLTVLAIAGTAIMRSISNAIDTTQEIRDLTKVVFLTEGKLHELEMVYDRKAIESVKIGDLSGRYTQPGAEEFMWYARVEPDRDGVSFEITVWTNKVEDLKQTTRRRMRRSRNIEYQGFMLKTIVPAARINDTLLFGGTPGRRPAGGRGSQRGGERGSRGR